MLRYSIRRAVLAGVLATAALGGTVAHAQTNQTQNQTQNQCNNTTGGPIGLAGAGLSMGAINVAAALPLDLQLSCLVNVLGPNQGQAAQQSATP